jgi:predicted PhzF superfamily epimerase YddE/YHI9
MPRAGGGEYSALSVREVLEKGVDRLDQHRVTPSAVRRLSSLVSRPTALNILRVFIDGEGNHGNHLGIVLDGGAIPEGVRLEFARVLGLSETVFVDDIASAALQLFTPATELPFAGHPLIGAAWALGRHTGTMPDHLLPPAGKVASWTEGKVVWVRGFLQHTPPWWHEKLAFPRDIAELSGPLDQCQDAAQLWAWIDEPAGTVRARVFASRYLVKEDEACGSAAMRLAATLGREILIIHGEGSLIHARPRAPGMAEVGGLVSSDFTVLLG